MKNKKQHKWLVFYPVVKSPKKHPKQPKFGALFSTAHVILLLGWYRGEPQKAGSGRVSKLKTPTNWEINFVFSAWRLKNITPRKFNSSPLKNDGWKTILSFWDGNFSGAMVNFQGVVKMGIFPKKGVNFLKPPASFFQHLQCHWILKEILKKSSQSTCEVLSPKQQSQRHQEKSIQNFVEEKSQGQPPGMYKTLQILVHLLHKLVSRLAKLFEPKCPNVLHHWWPCTCQVLESPADSSFERQTPR